MQTFLPYPDFKKSAKCLDYKRLGKQRVKAYQILQCLLIRQTRWHNHPAVLMWKGHEAALIRYGLDICHEWINRGYKDTCFGKIFSMAEILGPAKLIMPQWLNNQQFHLSHQSNLVRKLPEHYKKYFPDVPDDLPYYWPSKHI